ncbi:hypothetical protein EXS56_00555 [Candidatus Kaiserbacteria bacterium]|nr:hypothetical protein [Candidatus Kaiserbacteria bacterium]
MTFRRFAPLALLFLVVLFVFAPLLFFGKAFSGEEQIGFYYALAQYVQNALHTGTSLVWNGADYGGVSSNLDQFASTWNPVNRLLFSVLPLFLAQHISIVIGIMVGLFLSYWFGRRQGWHAASAITLALGYLSATTFSWLQLGTLPAYAFMVFPGLLLALQYMSESFSFRTYLLALISGGAVLGFGFLAGFAQIIFYNSLILGLYALFLDWKVFSKVRSLYRNFRVTFGYIGMCLIGLLLGFAQWFPSAALINLTTRTSTFAIQNATNQYPIGFFTFILPPYFALPFFGGGASPGFYIGALGFMLAIFGLFYYRTSTALFFASMYALVLAFAFHLPGFSWLNEHLPPFSHMSGNFRWMIAGAFPLAYLGAAGLEGLLRDPGRISVRARSWCVWGSGMITLLLAGGSILLGKLSVFIIHSPNILEKLLHWYTDGRTLQYPTEYYIGILSRTVSDTAALFSLRSPNFVFGLWCWLAATLFFVAFRYKPNWRYTQYLASAFIVMTVCGTFALQWNVLVPQNLYTETPKIVQLLRSRESDPYTYRTLSFIVGDGLYSQVFSKYTETSYDTLAAMERETLAHDTNLFFGIQQMDGMKAFRTLRANQLLSTIIGYDSAAYIFDPQSKALGTSKLDQFYNRDVQKQVPLDEKIHDFLKKIPLLSMMNVKYIYSSYQLPAPALTLISTVSLPVKGASLYVYENDAVLPRMYFAASAYFFSGTDTELLLQMLGTNDFSKKTFIECSDCVTDSPGKGSITVTAYENGKMEASTKSDTGQWLVFSESALPGWHATIDGMPVPIYAANYLFQAIRIPPGEHRISFTYRDVSVLDMWRNSIQR